MMHGEKNIKLHMLCSVHKAAITDTLICKKFGNFLQEYIVVVSTLCAIRMSIIHIYFPQTESRLHVDEVQRCHINKGC
jgi:hypothetical protein